MKKEIYYAYCFTSVDGWHTPALQLNTSEECFRYINLQSRLFAEVRICDAEDFCVMRSIGRKLIIPWTDGSLREFDLDNWSNRETE